MLPHKTHHSLAEASEHVNCKPGDLLHYAVQKLITLYVGIPDGVYLRVYDEWTKQDVAPFLARPQLLALEPSYCLQVEINGKTEQSDFLEGYSIESAGQLRKLRPSYGRPELNVRWVYWRTYRDNLVYPLLIVPEHLFVVHADLIKLIELAAMSAEPKKNESTKHKAVKPEITNVNSEHASPEAKNDDPAISATTAKIDPQNAQTTDAGEKKPLKDLPEFNSNASVKNPTILRLKQFQMQTGLSRSTIYDKMNPKSPRFDPTFPKQVNLGTGSVGWYEGEIGEWVLSRKGAGGK